MEYVEGQEPRRRADRERAPARLEPRRGLGHGPLRRAGYLHSRQPPIIYRDLKPANVMLTPTAAQADRLRHRAVAAHQSLARHGALGTDGYAPLEQYSPRSEPRSDLYALGASMYHLLTGRVPECAAARVGGQSLTPLRAINRGCRRPWSV